jgi:glycosyltransferase involved in cell wall biosynthesis
LVIIQNRETQFDAPLYQLIHQSESFSLQVIYTTQANPANEVDPELGRAPCWDHLNPQAYPRRTLQRTNPWAMAKLARQLQCQQPTLVVICGYFPRSHLVLALLLRLQGQRIGLRSDNTLTHTAFTGLKGRLRRLAVGWIQVLFHSWHPVGEQALAHLYTLSGTERPSFRFAYAVDNEWFAAHAAPSRLDRPAFLHARSWPEDAFVVLGILKWMPREDPLTLVEGFRRLQRACPRARLILVGDGPLRKEVAAACARLADRVHCPGYVAYSQLPLWYGRADVFVHPAPDEPWGVSVNEALACGLPVVAADGVGAAVEMITPGVCGSVFASGNAAELAAQLEALAAMPDARRAMAPACCAAADRWHYRHTIATFEQALVAC